MPHQKENYPKLVQTDFLTCISFNLKRSARKIDGIYRKHLKPHEVTVSQLHVLAVIGQTWAIAQSELGKVLVMERSTVSRDLKRLIEKGFVERSGRVNKAMLSITPKGAQFLEDVIPSWEAAMAESQEALGVKRFEAVQILSR